MKKIRLVAAWLGLIAALRAQTTFGCSEVIEPFRKSFRRANAVFLAEVTEISTRANVDYKKSLVDGEISFRIINSWKGGYRESVTLAGNVGWACGCSHPNEFTVGTKYIVAVDKMSNANFCASTNAETDYGKKMAGRLDSFWFRSWAGIYPF